MKRIICILLCSVMLIIPTISLANYEDAVSAVQGMGIMSVDEHGDFRGKENITRAEFTAVVCRMLAYENVSQEATDFSDVPRSHWASGYIALAHVLGLIGGVGDGRFEPESYITYNEATKILVCALGYDVTLDELTYPNSYLILAVQNGITNHMTDSGNPMTRFEAAQMLDNALNAYPIDVVYGVETKYKRSETTLQETLLKLKGLDTASGIVMRSGKLSIDDIQADEGYVQVGDRSFRTDDDYEHLVGMYVDVYYDDDGANGTVKYISAVNRMNEVTYLNTKDAVIENNQIVYYDESDKKQRINIDHDTIWLFNGDVVSRPEGKSSCNRSYTIIDNDRDKVSDVIFITQAESVIVDSISEKNSALMFKEGQTYKGKNGFSYQFDNEDITYVIENKDGENIDFQDIKAGDAVSIIGNEEGSNYKLLVSDEKREGKIEVLWDDEAVIDGERFEIGLNSSGDKLFAPYVGMEGVFVIDGFGRVIGTHGSASGRLTYGYAAKAVKVGVLTTTIKIKIIKGGEPVKNVRTIGDEEKISYSLQNDSEEDYELADRVVYGIDPVQGRGETTEASAINPDDISGRVVAYELNKEGKIDKLNVYNISARQNYEFNPDIFSFGGERVTRGYIKDENTVVVCVPRVVNSMEDYYVTLNINEGTLANTEVFGVKGVYDNNDANDEIKYSEPADIIILKTTMDADLPVVVTGDSDICIIGSVEDGIDENGERRYEIELLNGQDVKRYYAYPGSTAYAVVSALKMGDLVQIAVNTKNELIGVEKRASIQGLNEYTDLDNIYGIVSKVNFNSYDQYSNELVDMVEVDVNSSNNPRIRIFKDQGQPVYMYNRRRGYISNATTNDVVSAEYSSGNSVAKLFALMKDNEAEAIVVIYD